MKSQLLLMVLALGLLSLNACSKRSRVALPSNLENLIQEAHKSIDPNKLSKWAEGIFRQQRSSQLTNSLFLPREQWPDLLTIKGSDLRSPTWVSLNGDGRTMDLQIEYAGSFGGLGIFVSTERFEPPFKGRGVVVWWTNNIYFYASP